MNCGENQTFPLAREACACRVSVEVKNHNTFPPFLTLTFEQPQGSSQSCNQLMESWTTISRASKSLTFESGYTLDITPPPQFYDNAVTFPELILEDEQFALQVEQIAGRQSIEATEDVSLFIGVFC